MVFPLATAQTLSQTVPTHLVYLGEVAIMAGGRSRDDTRLPTNSIWVRDMVRVGNGRMTSLLVVARLISKSLNSIYTLEINETVHSAL